jgi:hypothetical protein
MTSMHLTRTLGPPPPQSRVQTTSLPWTVTPPQDPALARSHPK